MSTLEIVLAIFGIFGPLLTWAIMLWRSGKNKGTQDTETRDSLIAIQRDVSDLKAKSEAIAEIKIIKDDIQQLKEILGNGAYKGIKQDLHQLELDCGKQITALQAQCQFNAEAIRELRTRE
jgi:hypothetical protein